MKSIADNRAYQHVRTLYDDALAAYIHGDEDAAGKALEAAFVAATVALDAVIDAHCARCVADALTDHAPLACPPARKDCIPLQMF
ncbi:MAG TPA: hypothetical protein VKU00_03925 [Chthonomonadaceae bacterium]|nr:hypothetical protein [Chthonomonadaceae bacterium]